MPSATALKNFFRWSLLEQRFNGAGSPPPHSAPSPEAAGRRLTTAPNRRKVTMDDGERILTEEEELAARDIKRMAARETAPSDGAIYAAVSQRDLTPAEREGIEKALAGELIAEPAAEPETPFGQREHDLLLSSIEHIANDWLTQLEHVRRNSYSVEALVVERAAKLRSDITGLFALGNAAMAEARRGEQVNAELTRELEKMSEERAS
jgi:hypothetical protein